MSSSCTHAGKDPAAADCIEAAGLAIGTSSCRTWADLEIPMFRSGQAKQEDPTIQAAAVVRLALRAILLSDQDQCSYPGKQTEAADSPGTPGRRRPRNASQACAALHDRRCNDRPHPRTAPGPQATAPSHRGWV